MSNLTNDFNKGNSTRTNAIDDRSNVSDVKNTGHDNSSFKCTL